MEDLEAGNSLLIFPETDQSKKHDDICKLDSGFIGIARWVFERTHRRIRFYPIAINPYARAVQIGKPVLFNPLAPFGEEKRRIKEELERRITRMYQELARRHNREEREPHPRFLPRHLFSARRKVA